MSDAPAEFRCRCTKTVCYSAMTQEDLLCDPCREGCSLIGFSPETDAAEPARWLHIKAEWLEFRAQESGVHFFPPRAWHATPLVPQTLEGVTFQSSISSPAGSSGGDSGS